MQVQKVTDPAKIVSDPVLLAALARQGVDQDCVELWHDYAPRSRGKGYSPYSKLYRDLNSSRQFMVVSGLPMVDAYGQGHELTWRDKNGTIENGNNIFHAVVQGNDTRLIALNDQPAPGLQLAGQTDGAKKDDEVTFHPQLYIGGVEVLPVSSAPKLLETDPVNSGYHNNVLEWDYVACRRRLRIIEGRFLGSWVFTADPHDDVLIRYNQRGSLRLRLQYTRGGDEEFIPKGYFEGRELPVIISDSATFYPDANPESTSVDGHVYHSTGGMGTGVSWLTLTGAAGSAFDDASNTAMAMGMYADNVSSKWRIIYRSIFLFNTSSLPDDAAISAATLSFYGYSKLDNLSVTPNINVYSSNPASSTGLAAADFHSLGATAFCDTPKTYASWSTAGYNDFSLNASGIASISKTDVSKFGTRNANYDVANTSPTWSSANGSNAQSYTAEKGTGYKPKLVVTYTAGEQKTAADSGAGTESIAIRTLEGTDQASGGEAGLAATAVLASDEGSGNEIGGLLQSYNSSDQGIGADSLKLLSEKAGGEMRLHGQQSQVALPHKEVRK